MSLFLCWDAHYAVTMECALDVSSASAGSIECGLESFEVAWPENTAKKVRETFLKALRGAFSSGLKLRVLGDRLRGFSVPITLDPELCLLVADIAATGGSCNSPLLFKLSCFNVAFTAKEKTKVGSKNDPQMTWAFCKHKNTLFRLTSNVNLTGKPKI